MNEGVLHSLRTRLQSWLVLRLLLLLLGVVAILALGLMLLDAALDFSETVRVLAPWTLAACAALLIGEAIWRRRRLKEQRVARLFERAQPSLGNRLINAVQLSTSAGTTGIQEFLRLEAVELGRSSAAQVATWPVVRWVVVWAGAMAGIGAVCWLCLVIVGGDLLQTVVPRFLDPRGDHPPYSRLRLEVTPGKTQVLYGGQVEVRAKVGPSGIEADKLWLVAKSGTNVLRAIMFLAPDKSFFQTMANLREPTEYYVTSGHARSHRFPISVRYTPQITLVEVSTDFPAYTGKPSRTAKLTEEPQALPEDTRVSFRVLSNRPLKSGELSLTPVLGGTVRRIPLEPEQQSTVVTGAFTLSEPVVFSISVRDVRGLDSREPRQGRFNLLPDERPRIFVLEPGRDAVATPSIRVPVRVEANDDYGVSRILWLRGLNRSIERPFSMKLTAQSGPQSVQALGSFDLDKIGVRVGDVIDYYFEAADNYPKGPNVTLSKLYRLQVISQQQYDMILRQAAARKALFEPYFRLGAWLQRLAERARNLQKQAESGSEAERKAAASEAPNLAEDLQKYESELAKVMQQAVLFDVEQAFRNTLVEQSTRIGQARKKLGAALGSGQLDLKKLVEAAQDLDELAQREQEEVVAPAGQIAAVAQVLARADTFVKLARQQAALAQLLRRFSDKIGDLSRIEQMEMQELAHQQRRIQEQLRNLLSSFPELLARLPEDPQFAPLRRDVEAFVKAVGDVGIEDDLAQSAKNIAALDGKAGHQVALTAAEKMDRLISKCNGLPQQGKACLRFKPSVQQAMGNTLEQILAAMGAGQGSGQGGQDGYGLFNDDVALYGPNVELAGQQAGGGRSPAPGGRRAESVAAQSRDPGLNRPAVQGRVRLQPDARFPLRYRDLVGEYFKAIAETQNENGGNR